MNATSNCANFRCNNIANLVAASIVLLTEVRNLRVAPLVSVYVLSHYFKSYFRFFKIIFTIDYRFWTSASAANMRRVPGSLRSGTTTSWLLPVYLFIRKTPFAKGSLKNFVNSNFESSLFLELYYNCYNTILFMEYIKYKCNKSYIIL